MNLELIHYVQEAYREVLQAMSRPGEKRYVRRACSIKEILGIMLLDREVTFNMDGENKEGIEKRLKEITGVIVKEEEADYSFVLKNSKGSVEVMKKAKIGSLINPQKSTTVIKEWDKHCRLIDVELSGPGIKGIKESKLPLSKEEVYVRAEKNKEYPLGIDIILFSEEGEVIGLPRTVKIDIKERM